MGENEKPHLNKKTLVNEYMTPVPRIIGKDMPLSEATALMDRYQIRHLPVDDRGELIGMVSLSDLDRSINLSSDTRVEEVMSPKPFSVKVDSDLKTVVERMMEDKYGSAVIEDDSGRVVGIFTAIDALSALNDRL